jgi:hypothetical protein
MAQECPWYALEGMASTVQLPQQHTKGVDITAPGQLAMQHHLWGHVGQCPLQGDKVLPITQLLTSFYKTSQSMHAWLLLTAADDQPSPGTER